MKHQEAKQWVMDGMQSCIPPGCPLPFSTVSSIVSAKKNCVVATVEMFDGLPSTIELSQQEWKGGSKTWILSWQNLPGGAVNWTGTRWERVNNLAEQDEQIKQLVLF